MNQEMADRFWFEYLMIRARLKHCFKIYLASDNGFKKKQLKIHDANEALFLNFRDK